MSEETKQPAEETPEEPQEAPQEEAPPAEEKVPDEKAEKAARGKKKKEKTYTLTREQMEAAELAARQLESVKDQFVRLTAEYDNYRKRTAKEKDNLYQDAKADTIKEFLAVYDNLERAVATEGDEDSPHKKGLEMIFHQFKELLAKEGVKEIETKGKEFDPELMDAVMHIEDERLGENVVAQVFQAGFDLTMVGLDVTQKVRLTTDHVAILDKYAAPENRPIVDYLKQALPFYFRFNRLQNNCLDHCPVHDPLAMLAAVDPSVVTVRTIPARVECGGSFCRGMVVADLREHPIEAPGVSICVDVDSRRALEELLTTFMA